MNIYQALKDIQECICDLSFAIDSWPHQQPQPEFPVTPGDAPTIPSATAAPEETAEAVIDITEEQWICISASAYALWLKNRGNELADLMNYADWNLASVGDVLLRVLPGAVTLVVFLIAPTIGAVFAAGLILWSAFGWAAGAQLKEQLSGIPLDFAYCSWLDYVSVEKEPTANPGEYTYEAWVFNSQGLYNAVTADIDRLNLTFSVRMLLKAMTTTEMLHNFSTWHFSHETTGQAEFLNLLDVAFGNQVPECNCEEEPELPGWFQHFRGWPDGFGNHITSCSDQTFSAFHLGDGEPIPLIRRYVNAVNCDLGGGEHGSLAGPPPRSGMVPGGQSGGAIRQEATVAAAGNYVVSVAARKLSGLASRTVTVEVIEVGVGVVASDQFSAVTGTDTSVELPVTLEANTEYSFRVWHHATTNHPVILEFVVTPVA